MIAPVLILLVGIVNADIYMHIPRGSNNRLDGQNRERRNANRVFDSQNNDRGGYNVGRDKAKVIGNDGRVRDVPVGEMNYYVGSTLTVEWTNQHECGGSKAQCDLILQYMCDPNLRDGTTTQTIPERDQRCPRGDCNSREAQRFGQQEPASNYNMCRLTQRNKGLFTADQDLDGDSAIYTRQNPGGTRRGLECPEERDYYPYWRPSPWVDIAIMTSDTSRCQKLQDESFNVKAKQICLPNNQNDYFGRMAREGDPDEDELMPSSKAECESKTYRGSGFTWTTVQPNGAPKPECMASPKSRDNHLGNGGTTPFANFYNWTIPNVANGQACALRIRYNISTGDFPPQSTFVADNEPDIGSAYGLSAAEAKQRNYELENNPDIKPLKVNGQVVNKLQLELAINTAQLARTFQDRSHKFKILPRPANIPANTPIHNLNVKGKRGNIVQVFPATEYDFSPNDLHVKQGDYIHMQWTGSNRNPNNNDGEGRQGTDRSNAILLKPKNYPEGTGANMLQPAGKEGHLGNNYPEVITNTAKKAFLNLGSAQAKKAAILVPELIGVQDEPEEIKDEPEELAAAIKDAKKEDFDDATEFIDEIEDEEEEISAKADEKVAAVKNDAISRRRRRRRRRRRSSSSSSGGAQGAPNAAAIARTQRDLRRRLRLATLDDAPAYFDLGAVQANSCDTYRYMCTRNNNFSNRSQKGKVTVECN